MGVGKRMSACGGYFLGFLFIGFRGLDKESLFLFILGGRSYWV